MQWLSIVLSKTFWLIIMAVVLLWVGNLWWDTRTQLSAARDDLKQAQDNLKLEREAFAKVSKRNKVLQGQLEEYTSGRTDQESKDWAADPIPSAEYDRMRKLIEGYPASVP